MINYNLDKIYTDIMLPACANRKCEGFEYLLDRIDQSKLLEVCQQNEIASIVGHYLSENVKDRTLLSEWADEVKIVHDRTGAYLNELSRIARIFDRKGIALIGLKNSGIAANLIRNPSLFPMGDVDVLIARENFPLAHEILQAEGYELKSPNHYKKADFNEGYSNGSNEYQRKINENTYLWFELLWRSIDGRFIANSQEIQGSLLIQEAVANADTQIYNLSPVHNLLQVCIHTAKHSYVRAPGFRLHLDVHRIVGTTEIDWQIFLSLVKQYRVCTIVYFSLVMPKQMFGTNIPDKVIEAVKPRVMKRSLIWRFINRAGVFYPNERKFNLWQFILFTALLHDGPGTIFEIVFQRENEMWFGNRKRGLMVGILGRFKRLYKLVFHHTGT